MKERLSKLAVTQKAIDISIKHSDSFKDDIPSFVKEISIRIKREQPELYGYIQLSAQHSGATDLLAYGLGVSLTYDILPKSHTQKPLTTGEISTMHHTLVEHAILGRKKEGKQKAVIELSWFIDKLREDSPIFVDWLQDSLEQIESMEGKKSFTLGTIHVSMPFFMREEGKEMEQILFQEG